MEGVPMDEDDLAYFMRRANEELQRADECPDPAIAEIHRKLAAHYEDSLAALHRIVPPPAERKAAVRWAGP